MKFNIRNLKLKKSRKSDNDAICGVDSNHIIDADHKKDLVNLEDIDSITVHDHLEPNIKPTLLSLKTTTKMKRGNNNVKQGEKFVRNLTLKSIGVSLANLFKPNVRLKNYDF